MILHKTTPPVSPAISRTVLTAVIAVGALSMAACNRSSTETAETGSSATAVADAVDATPTTGETASARPASTQSASNGDSSTRTSANPPRKSDETLHRDAATTGALPPPPAAPGTARETIEVTRSGLSPAGASSGPTAPH